MLTQGSGTDPGDKAEAQELHTLSMSPCHCQAHCDNESAVMWYKSATILSKLVFLSDPLQGAEIRPHRSELLPRAVCGESEKYSRARGPFCRPPIDHFAGPRRGASEADQGPQKPTGVFRKKKAVILTTIPSFPKN
jgi:hypothetical protein